MRVFLMGIASVFIWFELCAPLAAEQNKIVLNLPMADFPPFIFVENRELPNGVMVDIFKTIGDRLNMEVAMQKMPTKRVYEFLDKGIIDADANSKEWVAGNGIDPDRYLWSDPVLTIREVVFSRKGHG